MFVEVIIPVSVPKTYTYGVPIELHHEIQIGQRVEVEFGRKKRYAAVVCNITTTRPAEYEIKPILSIIDRKPIILPQQINFWKWVSSYYMANIGDVMAAALPSALKLSSLSSVRLILQEDFDINELDDDEYLVFEALSKQNELSINDIQLIVDKKNVYPILNRLVHRKIIAIEEQLQKKYKPKLQTVFALHDSYKTEKNLQLLLDDLERAPKQQEFILHYISSYQSFQLVSKKEFLTKHNLSSSIYKALLEKQILIEQKQKIDRLKDYGDGDLRASLTPAQAIAYQEIKLQFDKQILTLLHGVTGSGKTHIYIKLIEETIAKGKQALYLLPEISLTTQIIKRLQKHFGNEVGVYHSKFNDAERVEIWNKTFNKEYKVILGARSAIFLPFQQLDVVIIDEEHDTSYKQFDPSPRYHARDAAIWLAAKHKANVLLGSATPSFESYFNAIHNKYALVELNERFGKHLMPKIEIVNMLKQRIPGNTYNKFSKRLIDELKHTLEYNKQAILFRNRRGYSSFIQCSQCAHNIKCIHCDVSLTYHKYRNRLECHYCGYHQQIPFRCPACGNNEMSKVGLGTERIEEELTVFLPHATFARMDLDTTRNKHGHEKIIDQFEQKKVDILVGTQMVTKGLHFDDVRLVGVIQADAILKFPNFRAGERALQLLEQVSGRAGRNKEPGLVIIQVRDENDLVLKYLIRHDYKGYYHKTISERLEWKYPPYYRQIKITCKHKHWKTNAHAANLLATAMRNEKLAYIKGPSEPFVSKINTYYIQEIVITIPKKADVIKQVKQLLQHHIDTIQSQKGNSQIRFSIDVDVY